MSPHAGNPPGTRCWVVTTPNHLAGEDLGAQAQREPRGLMEANGAIATATDSNRRNKKPEAGWTGTAGTGVCRDAGARRGPGEAEGKGHGTVSQALSADQGTATTSRYQMCCHHRSLGTLLTQPHRCAALPEHTAHRLSWTSDGESQTCLDQAI